MATTHELDPAAPERLRVLVVDDPDDRHAELLAAGESTVDGVLVEALHVARVDEAVDLVAAEAVDVALIALGGTTGEHHLDLLRRVVEHSPRVPVVVVTDDGVRDVALEAVQAGAEDALTREEIADTTGFVRHLRIAMQRRRAELTGLRRAGIDPLTELVDRDGLTDALAGALARRRRGASSGFAVLFVDLDGFKAVNDTHGHLAGDHVLIEVARRLRACVREVDAVARAGGDEFVLVVEQVEHPADATIVADRIERALTPTIDFGQVTLSVSASVGITLCRDGTAGVEQLLADADTAMYEAKRRGKRQYCFHDEMQGASVRESVRLHGLHEALRDHEFVVHYQPQIDTRSSRVRAVEALVRWAHPRLGLLRPSEFLHLLARSGLLAEVGASVLRQALADAAAWRAEGLDAGRIAVNVAASQVLPDPGAFETTVFDALEEAGLAPDVLELELTDPTELLGRPDVALALTRLARAGVQLVIDDFGAEAAAFACLKELPVQGIKIDRRFVRDMTDDRVSATVIDALVTIGRRLHLSVVGEGVETQEQRIALRAAGVHAIQGYLCAMPQDATELQRWLRRR